DKAPPHFSLSVRKALNGKYPDSWIGRDGPIPWPARSPDLTPLDFFFWGYIKNIVYSERIADINHLKRRIIAAIETVTPDILFKTWKEIAYRLDKHHFYLDDLDYFGVGVAVPKVLGDIFESVAGAIYLDNGSSLDAVWKVIYPMIRPAMKKFFEQTPVSPVNELFDRVKSAKIFQDPVVRDNKIYIKVILPDGRQYEGVGPNKKVAKQTAAKKALLDLRSSVLDASQ
ncbi:unnamed protein product, partial [Larinioides sclopetarius]